VLTKAKLDAIRERLEEHDRLLETGAPDDLATLIGLTEVSAWLVANIRPLLSEIERLRADRPEPSAATIYVKYDGRGGTA
jgi:hypothetical protein